MEAVPLLHLPRLDHGGLKLVLGIHFVHVSLFSFNLKSKYGILTVLREKAPNLLRYIFFSIGAPKQYTFLIRQDLTTQTGRIQPCWRILHIFSEKPTPRTLILQV